MYTKESSLYLFVSSRKDRLNLSTIPRKDIYRLQKLTNFVKLGLHEYYIDLVLLNGDLQYKDHINSKRRTVEITFRAVVSVPLGRRPPSEATN